MLGVFWNPQDLLLLMDTDIFKIEKLTKTRVSKILSPTVCSASATIQSNLLCAKCVSPVQNPQHQNETPRPQSKLVH